MIIFLNFVLKLLTLFSFAVDNNWLATEAFRSIEEYNELLAADDGM